GVGRFAYNLNDQLQFGTLLTGGDPDGSGRGSFTGFDTGWHTAHFLGDQNLDLTGWAAHTGGGADDGTHRGWGFDAAYPNVFWYWEAQVNVFGQGFDPALGFLPRPGTRQYYEVTNYYAYPEHTPDQSVEYYAFGQNYNRIDGLDGHTQSAKL